jgi:hypothetical protein
VSQLPIYSSHVRLLERLPDGSVNFHEELAVREPHYSMALNGAGEVVLTPRGAATRMYERYMPDNDVVRRKAVGHVLRRLGRAGGVSLWALKSDWSDQDIDSPSTPPVSVTEYRVLSSTDLSLWMRPDGWTPTQHNYAHPLFCNEPGVLLGPRLAQCGYVQQRYLTNVVSGPNAHTVQEGYALNNQGAAAVPGGENYFNFMLDIGRSRLTINNGETETHFWRLAPGGTSAVPAVFLTRSLQGEYAGETMVGLTLSLLYNPNGFPTPEPLGSWQNGYSQAQAPSYVGPDIAVRLSRYADGSSPYTISTDGTDTLQQQSWTMVGHGIFNAFARASFPDGSVRDVGECAQAVAQGATSCTSLIRYFRPLANTRRSYYGIEEQYQVTYPDVAFPPPGQPLRYRVTRMMSRPGYQSCEAGACLPLFDYVIAQAAVSASTPAGVAGWLDRRSTVRTSRAARFIMPLRSQARSTPVQHEDENLFALDHGRQPDDDCRACGTQLGGVPPRASSRAEHDGSAGEPPLDVGGDHDEGPRGDSAPIGTPPFKQVGVPAKVESKPATPSSSS